MSAPDTLPKAILLDMDDTILAYSAGAEDTWRALCAGVAPRLSLLPQALYHAVERQRQWYWSDPERHRHGRQDMDASRAEIFRAALAGLGVEAGPLPGEMALQFADLREGAIRPFPGAIEKLEMWRSAGVRLALLTNGGAKYQRAKIERFGLARHFDCVLVEGESGVGKPDERMYRRALEALAAEPSEAWMVGDNLEWEVMVPQRLGMAGIWVDFRGEGLPPGSPVRPDRIIRALTELP